MMSLSESIRVPQLRRGTRVFFRQRRVNAAACALSLCAMLVFVAGCGQPLRSLMELGAEQDALQRHAASQSDRFAGLLSDVKSGALAVGTARATIIDRYGEPVVERDGTLLYRAPVAFFEGTKVYLDLDAAGVLKNIRVIERSGP